MRYAYPPYLNCSAHTTEFVVFQLGLDYLFCKFTLQNPDANAASTTPGALFLTRGSLMKPRIRAGLM